MWPLPTAGKILLASGVTILALIAFYETRIANFKSERAEELRKMYVAGVNTIQRREEVHGKVLERYREDLARARRSVRRVYVCPEPTGPTDDSTGAGSAASPGVLQGVGRDITHLLQQCYQYGKQLSAADDFQKQILQRK